jgi:hypothetical protein
MSLLLLCLFSGGVGATPRSASLEGQLVEMLRLLYVASNINVINGLNLSKDQLEALRDMTSDVEKAAEPVADCSGSLSADLARVKDAYCELHIVLLSQGVVSEELRSKVVEARKLEASFIRSSLVFNTSYGYGECRRCHAEPGAAKSAGDSWQGVPAGAAAEQGFAHIYALLGRQGLAAVAKKGEAVNRILTDNQKVMLQDFSCCLIPPQSLSDPVRIGQAEVAEWEVKLLTDVRKVPDSRWPAVKSKILDILLSSLTMKDPGITARQKEEARTRMASVLEETRGLSDVDFELKKESLVAQMKGIKKSELGEKQEQFKRAFFLLMPGSREVYDRRLANPSPQ